MKNTGKAIRELNQEQYFEKNLIPFDVAQNIDIERLENIEVEI